MVKKKSEKSSRNHIISLKELKLLGYYIAAGVVLSLILLIFGVSVWITFSKFYGFIWMFLIPGLFIFRAVFKYKIFPSNYEEYGYPVLISWLLHAVIIVFISGVFKSAVTDINLYGTSFVLFVVAIVVFYLRKK